MALSKSSKRAMGCEEHYVAYHLDRIPALRKIRDAESTTVGLEFHQYRAEYVQRLVYLGINEDKEWAREWLDRNAPSSDGRALIQIDLDHFTISPETVVGTEVYLNLDQNLEPLDLIIDAEYETIVRSEGMAVEGFIDLLRIEGDTAYATDYKTSRSTDVDEFEAQLYAAMIFAHFPGITRIEWAWEFIRAGAGSMKRMDFIQADLPWIKALIRDQLKRQSDLIARHEAGECNFTANPFSGLCSYCHLDCSVRSEAVAIQPLQSIEDAQELARRVKALTDFTEKARGALRAWIDSMGPVLLPDNYVADIHTSSSSGYPLPDVLKVLGVPGGVAEEVIDNPEDMGEAVETIDKLMRMRSPKWDVPLSKLMVSTSALHGYARARKRDGFGEELASIAVLSPRSELTIRRIAASQTPSSEG
jgi:hypothetical protein